MLKFLVGFGLGFSVGILAAQFAPPLHGDVDEARFKQCVENQYAFDVRMTEVEAEGRCRRVLSEERK